MSEDLNLSVNGHSKVPPGFRFHPTEEELLHYYLRKKVACEKIDLDVIRNVDLNKLEPWDIQEKCKIGTTPQNEWYFFSHNDKKYPTGTRTNRATTAGFWKATGRDKVIRGSCRRIGMRKTLVFYRGRAPHGQKSDWIMHEYRLDDNTTHDSATNINASNIGGDSGPEEGWVVCRVFKKKNYHKTPESASSTTILPSNLTRNEGDLDQMLMYMGASSSYMQENELNMQFTDQSGGFLHLPQLESPYMNPSSSSFVNDPMTEIGPPSEPSSDWVTLDRLVASQRNGHEPSKQYSGYREDFSFSFDHDEVQLNMNSSDHRPNQHQDVSSSETDDLWNFA